MLHAFYKLFELKWVCTQPSYNQCLKWKKRSAGTQPTTPPPHTHTPLFDYLLIYLFILNKYFLIIHNVCILPQSINQ